jgi:uncharacterized protein YwqG
MKLVKSLIKSFDLEEHTDLICSLVQPAVGLATKRVAQSALAPMQSRVGGHPHLPKGFVWPRRDGVALAHVATINLSEASAHDESKTLPKSGRLVFFYDVVGETWGYDPADRDGFFVQYFDDTGGALIETPMPLDGADPDVLDGVLGGRGSFRACQLVMKPILTLPSTDDISSDDAALADLASLDEYDELVFALREKFKAPHQLLGHPNVIQNSLWRDCQLASSGVTNPAKLKAADRKAHEAGEADWGLLLQLDSDSKPDWMWCDGGILYFAMRKQDLAARRFKKAWFQLQSC